MNALINYFSNVDLAAEKKKGISYCLILINGDIIGRLAEVKHLERYGDIAKVTVNTYDTRETFIIPTRHITAIKKRYWKTKEEKEKENYYKKEFPD